MSVDTTAANRALHRFDGLQQIWLFGYGSLIFKPDFPFIERRVAHIRGWQRRFWQGSHDHRGTPEYPGRVVTLVPCAGARCDGMAYLITSAQFDHLDRREKNGYLRCLTTIHLDDGNTVDGLVYVADAENAAYLGAASEAVIARQIADASGPSGSNRDYLIDLASALKTLGATDPHVFALADLLATPPSPLPSE